jgi:tRNA pseudouridine55 synthase
MDGLLLVHKPEGPTSHDVVVRLRRILGTSRIGHFGTLDPFASGLLLAGVGKATRLFPFIGASDKTYEGRIRLGVATETYDRTGRVVASGPSTWPDLEAVRSALRGFLGEVRQLPPPFSAKKYQGRPLYAYARRREAVERKPCRVTIRAFDLKEYAPPDLFFEVSCSAGTYIRSLAHDLGSELGCGAHLADLVRTGAGPYRLADAVSLETLADLAAEGRIGEVLLPLERLLLHLPRAGLNPEGWEMVKNGRPLLPSHLASPVERTSLPEGKDALAVRIFNPDGRLVALARPGADGATLLPFLVLA